jgi:hypothetical protein
LAVTETGAPWAPSPELDAELRRVGVAMDTAGFAAGVLALDLGERVTFLGPPRETPRRRWNGTEREALLRLARLADGAGTHGFWDAFGRALPRTT